MLVRTTAAKMTALVARAVAGAPARGSGMCHGLGLRQGPCPGLGKVAVLTGFCETRVRCSCECEAAFATLTARIPAALAALQAAMANNLKRKALKMAENRPEIHVIGEIVGSTGFPSGVSCKWAMATGEKWTVLNGEVSGQTHTDYPTSDMAVWAHPIDVHYVAGTVHGWPRISVQVWKLDEYGRNEIQAYGFVHVPSTAGSFDLEISTWRPLGSHGVEVAGFFLGSKPQLASADMIVKDISDRYRLTTEAAGTVYVHVDVLFKNLELHHVEW